MRIAGSSHLTAALLLLFGAPLPAEEALVNYAFATWLGTGAYRVADRSVAILNLPVYYPLRETGEELWGIKLRLPVSLGFQNFDDFPDDLQTLSFVPGIELEIPLSEHWPS